MFSAVVHRLWGIAAASCPGGCSSCRARAARWNTAAVPRRRLSRQPIRPTAEALEDRCVPSADVFEPNDNFGQAFDLVTGDRTFPNLSIHDPGNDDYYRWTGVWPTAPERRGAVQSAQATLTRQCLTGTTCWPPRPRSAIVNSGVYGRAGQSYFIRVYGYSGNQPELRPEHRRPRAIPRFSSSTTPSPPPPIWGRRPDGWA
jgi:hypothetical protein